MSRAFIKEPDGDAAVEELPDRPVSPHPNYVTPEGLAAIDAELDLLRAAWSAAQAADDRAGLARIARDLRYWNARRSSAQPVPLPIDADQVRFGSRVTLARDDGRRQVFRIVGEDEADPAKGTVSYVAPLARALLRRSVGDMAAVAGREWEIVAID